MRNWESHPSVAGKSWCSIETAWQIVMQLILEILWSFFRSICRTRDRACYMHVTPILHSLRTIINEHCNSLTHTHTCSSCIHPADCITWLNWPICMFLLANHNIFSVGRCHDTTADAARCHGDAWAASGQQVRPIDARHSSNGIKSASLWRRLRRRRVVDDTFASIGLSAKPYCPSARRKRGNVTAEEQLRCAWLGDVREWDKCSE